MTEDKVDPKATTRNPFVTLTPTLDNKDVVSDKFQHHEHQLVQKQPLLCQTLAEQS